MNVVKLKAKQPQWPIITNVNNTTNQWKFELEANALQSRQARENARDQDTIDFGFEPDWLIRWRVFSV